MIKTKARTVHNVQVFSAKQNHYVTHILFNLIKSDTTQKTMHKKLHKYAQIYFNGIKFRGRYISEYITRI